MNSRAVIGKRIVSVEHYDWYDTEAKKARADVSAIVLEDGTRLVPFAYETIDCPAGTIIAVKPATGAEFEVVNRRGKVKWTGTLSQCLEFIGEQAMSGSIGCLGLMTRPKQ